MAERQGGNTGLALEAGLCEGLAEIAAAQEAQKPGHPQQITEGGHSFTFRVVGETDFTNAEALIARYVRGLAVQLKLYVKADAEARLINKVQGVLDDARGRLNITIAEILRYDPHSAARMKEREPLLHQHRFTSQIGELSETLREYGVEGVFENETGIDLMAEAA